MHNFCVVVKRLAEWINRLPRVPMAFVESDLGGPVKTRPRPLLELLFVMNGELALHAGNRTARLMAGDCALINAHDGNWGEPADRSFRYACVSLWVGGHRQFAQFGRAPLLNTRTLPDIAAVHRLYREVSLLYHSPPGPLFHPQSKGAVLRLLCRLHEGGAAEEDADDVGDRRLQRALDFIRRRLGDATLALPDIARSAGMSPHQLNRIFKREFGVSPFHYVLRMRLSRARGLLGQTQLSIKEIAAMTGFANQMYFSRIYRQMAAETPSTTRARRAGGPY